MVKTGFIAATVFRALSVQPFRRLSVTNFTLGVFVPKTIAVNLYFEI